MADNTELNAGSGGDVIATDDLGGSPAVKIQRVKPAIGADGVANDVAPVSAGMDVTGTTVPAAGMVAQFDDSATASVTENQFAPVRMSSRRALLVEGTGAGTAVKVDGSAVTQPVSGTVTANLAAGTNNIGDVDVLTLPAPFGAAGATSVAKAEDAASADADVGIPAMAVRKATPANTSGTDGDYEMLQMSAGRLWTSATVDAALPAGTNAIGKLAANSGVDIGDVDVLSIIPGTGATNLGKAEDAAHTTGDTGVMALAVRSAAPTDRSAGPTDGDYEPVAVNEVGAVWGTLTPSANGGCSIFRSLDIDETEEDVKTSAGVVYGYYIFNAAASTRYVKFYNATAASVSVGTTTPVLTIPVPTGSAANLALPYGIAFSTAICVAATTGVADSDTGAPSANDVVINVLYK